MSPRRRNCIPAPRRADQTFVKGESFAHFLRRSTSPVARRIRRFVNGNLALLPADAQVGICRSINSPQFHRANLELIAGRTLQELGATELEYEPVQRTGKRPDFLATFDDGRVFLDATQPEWNASLERRHRANERLIEVIEAVIPPGWSFAANRLPRIGLSAAIGRFRSALVAALAEVRVPEGRERLRVESPDPGVPFELELWAPRRSTERAWLAGPGVAEFVAPHEQIRDALGKKRAQLRGLPYPAVVALGGAIGAGIDDYDLALFGETVGHLNASGREIAQTFRPNGLFAKPGTKPPTIKAVLAFVGMDVTAGADPILYLHPRAAGSLPRALMQLRVRSLGPNGVLESPASVHDIFGRLSRSARGR